MPDRRLEDRVPGKIAYFVAEDQPVIVCGTGLLRIAAMLAAPLEARVRNRRLMICPWFGPLPPWWGDYVERIANTGCDFLFDHDLEAFRRRVRDRLGVRCSVVEGGPKIQDYRPALGWLYQDELAGYDWWGHTDFDCVYGRVGEFVTDEILDGCDIQSDCAHDYLAGPWTLYRNRADVCSLFAIDADWRERLEEEITTGWVEQSFTEIAKEQVRTRIDFFHGYLDADALLEDDDRRLLYAGREISFFHFRYTKAWPL